MNSLGTTRKEKGLTQDELSRLTGIRQSYLSEIERGVNQANQITRNKIESALNSTVDWIETESVKLRETNYYQAERLLKKLLELTLSMEDAQRIKITKMVCKYFKLKK